MAQKKYIDIERMKEKYADAFTVGERIVVQTKIDGSNASFTYNPETNSLSAFSRNKELNGNNTLNGFYGFVQSLNVEKVKEITKDGRFIIFGEWLVKHTVKYPEDKYNRFYMFDVWDTVTEKYLSYVETAIFCSDLIVEADADIDFVPVLYSGEFKSWEHLMGLLSENTTGASPCEEGIVIKSQDRLGERNSRKPYYLKIVNERFSEVHEQHPKKNVSPEVLAKREAELELAKTIVTARRAEKIIQKCVDEGVLRADWDEKDLGFIAKNCIRMMYDDCVKEEPETVAQIDNFGKVCGSLSMQLFRNMVK